MSGRCFPETEESLDDAAAAAKRLDGGEVSSLPAVPVVTDPVVETDTTVTPVNPTVDPTVTPTETTVPATTDPAAAAPETTTTVP